MQTATQSGKATRQKRSIQMRDLQWPVVIGILAMHIGALLAFFPVFFTWSAVVVCLFFIWLTGAIGITLGYHRMLTHKSFSTSNWLRYLITAIGCMAWQGGPVQWVGVHRIHHKHSDEDEDPHTPLHGFSWSHVLWCLHKDPAERDPAGAAKDLVRDPGMRLLDKYFWVPQFLLIPVLYFAGEGAARLGISASGVSWIVWGLCVRSVLVYHGTWFVNSATHTWGYRNFETNDNSTNLWWVAVVSFGEGWHNNHHAYQRSAAHGMRWSEFDLTFWTIKTLGWLGLAWDIVDDREAVKQARQAKPNKPAKVIESAPMLPANPLAQRSSAVQ